ncbi:MAG TPA: hypothetical protein VG713_10180 [Pirellulales bacterium]|nr:hypothetical protein [Pirellulales bacterium]
MSINSAWIAVAWAWLASAACADPLRHFAIEVLDDQTGRGVPLVELRTVNDIEFYTDNAGLVAFDEPGLMDRDVFFYVRSHGYEMAKDGFGYEGMRLTTTPGKRARIKLKRLNIAERLYRITGQGLYRDSVLLGRSPPIAAPLLNAEVLGQDSVMAAVYRDKVYWFWGDTNRASYPLGHFRTSGATSKLPEHGGLDPSIGIDFTYFTDATGFARGMCPFDGPGPVWIDGVVTVDDQTGRERLIAHYQRMKQLDTVLEHGLAVFNDDTQQFDKLATIELTEKWRYPRGQAFRQMIDGREYLLFAAPLPTVRVRATFEDVQNRDSYEALTSDRIWRTDAPPIEPLSLRDADSRAPVKIHAACVRWNGYLKKWIMIGEQIGGSSYLGELWFAAAEQPIGPWTRARKIVTHDRYSFYNPALHDFLDTHNGRYVYFEATYTHTFSGNDRATPRYEYNQIMYRLDLSDARLREVTTAPPAQ